MLPLLSALAASSVASPTYTQSYADKSSLRVQLIGEGADVLRVTVFPPGTAEADAEQGYWRCQRCGLYGQRKLVGLRSPCRPRREKKTWRRGHDAGRKPPAARQGPPVASSQGPSEGSKLANLVTRVRLRQSSRAQDAAPR